MSEALKARERLLAIAPQQVERLEAYLAATSPSRLKQSRPVAESGFVTTKASDRSQSNLEER